MTDVVAKLIIVVKDHLDKVFMGGMDRISDATTGIVYGKSMMYSYTFGAIDLRNKVIESHS